MHIVDTLVHALTTGFAFLLMITILVIVHEFGHYWVAKIFGMHVEAFAVMMGGVRKTDLSGQLKGSMVPAWVLWVFWGAVSFLTVIGALAPIEPLFMAGMWGLAVVGPVWVVLRICKLYHVTVFTGLSVLVQCWIGAAVILFLGTRFQNLDLGYALGMMMGASVLAVLIMYYRPVLRKLEDNSEQGYGHIEVDGEVVPVRFRPVWCTTDKHGTEFSLLLLPLGGFARIRGMEPKSDGSEVEIERGFYSMSAWKRFLVLLAGPAFSIGFGILLMVPYLAVRGEVADRIPVVQSFSNGSPAERAGLKVGDRITAINDQPVETFFDLTSNVRFSYHEGAKGGLVPDPLKVTYDRNGQTLQTEVKPIVSDTEEPVFDKDGNASDQMKYQAKLGVYPTLRFKPVPIGQAVGRAVVMPLDMTIGLGKIFSNYETAKQSVGGPGRALQDTSEAVNQGMWEVLFMAATLSMFLGILNLVPIPPLDGGQMLIAFVEMVRGNKRLSPSLQGALHTVGAVLVVLLMLAPLVIDANRHSEANHRALSEVRE